MRRVDAHILSEIAVLIDPRTEVYPELNGDGLDIVLPPGPKEIFALFTAKDDARNNISALHLDCQSREDLIEKHKLLKRKFPLVHFSNVEDLSSQFPYDYVCFKAYFTKDFVVEIRWRTWVRR